jgi:hypothetical protein
MSIFAIGFPAFSSFGMRWLRAKIMIDSLWVRVFE